MVARAALTAWLLLSLACAAPPADRAAPEDVGRAASRVEWAIAIHGGAGVIDREKYADLAPEYEEALAAALRVGVGILESGGSSLDAVEQVVRVMEDDPHFNAGKGAVFTHEGANELDALIMDGRDLACGAVTGVRTVKNPISLARKVMEESKHVFFSGEGAEAFADETDLERVDPAYFFTQRRYDQLQAARERERGSEEGTVGCVALDRDGNLAAATSTGGLTNKLFGRIGDTPIVGAGTYADNRTCAVSGTGKGEQFIRHTVARSIAALMEYPGLSLEEAAERVIHGELDPGDGGMIGVARDGSIALVFNSPGMFRGAADSSGRFEVAIWP
jgi:beta-aspartyl-peptidase (threonine type)